MSMGWIASIVFQSSWNYTSWKCNRFFFFSVLLTLWGKWKTSHFLIIILQSLLKHWCFCVMSVLIATSFSRRVTKCEHVNRTFGSTNSFPARFLSLCVLLWQNKTNQLPSAPPECLSGVLDEPSANQTAENRCEIRRRKPEKMSDTSKCSRPSFSFCLFLLALRRQPAPHPNDSCRFW